MVIYGIRAAGFGKRRNGIRDRDQDLAKLSIVFMLEREWEEGGVLSRGEGKKRFKLYNFPYLFWKVLVCL